MTGHVDTVGFSTVSLSPASTPDSLVDEEKYLVGYFFKPHVKKKKKLKFFAHIPLAIFSVSVLQILFHLFRHGQLEKLLRFEPSKRHQIWRLMTYMLVHDDWSHLTLNVVIQCVFAFLLEKRQGRIRVVALYLLGGVTGVLGASCVHPDVVIGASAGGYALLLSNVADIALNYENMKYKTYRSVSIAILVIFDVIYDIIHVCSETEPLVSWEAHIVGGVAGVLLGLAVFKGDCDGCKTVTSKRALFWTGVGMYCVMVVLFVMLATQVTRCTPPEVMRFRYIYFC